MSEEKNKREFMQLTQESREQGLSRYLRQKEKEQDNLMTILSICLSIFIIVIGTFFTYKYFKDKAEAENELFYKKNEVVQLEKQQLTDKIFNKRQNILILGVDSNGEGSDPFKNTRSDTIVILSINPKNKSINILSIPRDSKVYLAEDKGIDKINAAHAIGGIDLIKETIEKTFGIKIHNYIVFNTEGVVKFIDAIGGVPVYVEKDMIYNDYSGKLHVNLTKGNHILSGKESEGFLRFRKDALGDIGRTSRQQWFLRALAERMKDPEAIAKIPEALKIADKYIKSNLSLFQMTQYAALATGLDLSKIETATMPGSPNKKGSISYWILDPDKCREVINRMVYNKTTDIKNNRLPRAGIIYNNETAQSAMNLKQELEAAGYLVNCEKRSKLPHSQICGHTPIVTRAIIKGLKKNYEELTDLQFVYDPIHRYCMNSDFTVILSQSE